MSDKKPETDQFTGVETTGHEWDGLKELNNPAPRWWLWVFFVTIVWSVGYWVIYPAWPTLSGHTKGSGDWTQYKALQSDQQEIAERRGEMADKMRASSLSRIQTDPELYAFAQAAGRTMFRENCAACHGTGAQGGRGYPNLNDDDWLWGGSAEAIYHTLRHGIRAQDEETRQSQMPAFGEMLKKDEIQAVAQHVLSLSGKGKSSGNGRQLFTDNCAACHGDSGEGNRELGAPKLNDAIWLYGGDEASIMAQITTARHGVMPAWAERLPDETLKALAVYVHSLGGGEAEIPQ